MIDVSSWPLYKEARKKSTKLKKEKEEKCWVYQNADGERAAAKSALKVVTKRYEEVASGSPTFWALRVARYEKEKCEGAYKASCVELERTRVIYSEAHEEHKEAAAEALLRWREAAGGRVATAHSILRFIERGLGIQLEKLREEFARDLGRELVTSAEFLGHLEKAYGVDSMRVERAMLTGSVKAWLRHGIGGRVPMTDELDVVISEDGMFITVLTKEMESSWNHE